jgi:hypothetical protein
VSDPGSGRLPVRTGADVHLADAFLEPGCPLCRERARTEAAYLESILAESVNDIPFRQALDAARGFCGRHAAAILDADRRRAGSLGAAILLRATLTPRVRELQTAAATRGRARSGRVRDAARPPACPACERTARAEAGRAASLVALTADARWAEAVGAAPLCLEHLLALMGVASAPPGWPGVEARQLERLTDLVARLDGYAHTSSHDRRHRQTAPQRASPDEAAAVLAGWRRGPSGEGGRPSDPVATVPPVPPVPSPPDARAVLINGVYGSGKSSAAAELTDRLEAAGVPVALVDLDFLGWFAAPVDWDEHDDPRVGLANLAALRANFLGVGVRAFVLAGTVREASHLASLRSTLAMPLAMVRLDVPAPVIAGRLGGDPLSSRAEDLATAEADLADGRVARLPADLVVDGDRPTPEVAEAIERWLGWGAPDDDEDRHSAPG